MLGAGIGAFTRRYIFGFVQGALGLRVPFCNSGIEHPRHWDSYSSRPFPSYAVLRGFGVNNKEPVYCLPVPTFLKHWKDCLPFQIHRRFMKSGFEWKENIRNIKGGEIYIPMIQMGATNPLKLASSTCFHAPTWSFLSSSRHLQA